MDLSEHLEREKAPGDLKSLLIEVFQAQETLIYAQQEAMMQLLNENTEQETVIQELMCSRV